MKIKDKSIKLHLLKKLEDYNFRMDIGNLEYNKMELEEKKFYLFTFFTLVGFIIALIRNNDLFSLLLVFALIFEIIYIIFSQQHIKIANDIIINYQKRSVSKEYIDRLLKEIDEDWDLNWDRLHPILTNSMFKEDEEGAKENISLYGSKIENKPSIEYICKHLKSIYNTKKIVQIKGYVKWRGWQFAKEIKPQVLLGFLRKNIYVFTRINTIYDRSGYIDLYDFFNMKFFRYPKHLSPPLYKEGTYIIKAEVVKQDEFYYLHILEREFLKDKKENN